jgi:hypothetical protein
MKFAGNRLLWIVLGVALVAMLGFGAISTQSNGGSHPAASAPASASSQTAASSLAAGATQDGAKPFLTEYQDPQVQPAPNGVLTMLLGATANQINVLSEITDVDAVEELRTRPQPALPAAEPFLAYLKSVGDKVRPIAAEVAATATTPRELLKPADIVKRIEDHRRRLQESTVALQEPQA